MKGYRIRQVYDLPPIQIEVTEHKVEQKNAHIAILSKNPSFLLLSLILYNMVEYKKTDSLFNTLSVHFFETNKRILSRLFWPFYQRRNVSQSYTSFCFSIAAFVQEAKEKILQSSVVHFDETGMRVEGKTHWLHTASTPEVTLQHIHEKRGKEAMDAGEILPTFSGIAMHDGWKPYDVFTDCRHVLCHAHLLRDLQGIIDSTGQKWAQQMQGFLTQALHLKSNTREFCKKWNKRIWLPSINPY